MKRFELDTETAMQGYLDNPNRVSILARRVLVGPVLEELCRVGLQVDFRFRSITHMERQAGVLQRQGLGVLAVVGEAYRHDYDYTNETRHVPFVLKQMGIGDTPTVHIPLSLDQIVAPSEEGEGENDFTRILELTDDIRFNSRRILESGALLVKSVSEEVI